MSLFIYHWELVCENPIHIRGHGLTMENNYEYIDVKKFYAFSYYDCTIGGVEMSTSDDIYFPRTFRKKESNCKNELRGHMSELSVIPLFTSSKKVDFCGWIDKTSMKRQEINKHPLPMVLSFDIEVISSDSGMPSSWKLDDKIEMISCVFKRYLSSPSETYILHMDDYSVTSGISIPCSSECDILDKFFSIINDKDPDVIIGYNIYGFDFDYIISRLQYYLHKVPCCTRPNKKDFIITQTDWESAAYGNNNYQKIQIPGRIIFDLMLYFRRFKLEKYSLEEISRTFLGEGKEDMKYDEMARRFKSRKGLDEVASYCIKDSLLVLRLFDKFNIWNELCEMSKIMRCDIEDLYTRGEQLKVLHQIIHSCIEQDIVLVKREVKSKEEYQGAKVLNPEKGIYDNCAVLDFQSLYPSIVIAFNICPSTIKSNFSKRKMGIFPRVIQNLLQERKKVKTNMKGINPNTTEFIILDKKQNALKICANSMYGIMGFNNNKYFGSIECAKAITEQGRFLLCKTVEHINLFFPTVNVIYGDTDSCILSLPSNDIKLCETICISINKELPKPMSINFEDFFDRIILMSKKRYIMIKNGNLKFKGVMVSRRGYCQFAKDMYKQVIQYIATDVDIRTITEYIDLNFVRLINNEIDMDLLKMTKSVKNPQEYKVEVPQLILARRLNASSGTRLEYVFVNSLSDKQGTKMFTIDEVNELGLKIDGKYYIEKQVQNCIDELLELIGLEDYVKNWFKIE